MKYLLHWKKGEILRGYLKMNQDTPSVLNTITRMALMKPHNPSVIKGLCGFVDYILHHNFINYFSFFALGFLDITTTGVGAFISTVSS